MTREEIKSGLSALATQFPPFSEESKLILGAVEALDQEPREDAISRQAAIRIAEQGQVQGYIWQFKQLCDLPPVTPKSETVTEFADRCRECGSKYGRLLRQDRETGHWILKRTFPTKLYDEYLNEYKCSECYREIRCTESQLVNYPYCHCGAKMVESQESGEE